MSSVEGIPMQNKHPDSVLWGFNLRRRRPSDLSRNDFLRTIPFFEHLNDKHLKNLTQYLHERRYEENEYLFELNHPGAALFLIISGEVSVETSSDPSTAIQLAVLQSGSFIGELALLDQSPR